MERDDILNYTRQVTSKIFSNLYNSLGKKPKRRTKRNKKGTKSIYKKDQYNRLETDSSYEDIKNLSLRKKNSIEIQTDENIFIKEDLAKKDLEIFELRRMLSETQKQLESLIEKANLDSSTKPISLVEKQIALNRSIDNLQKDIRKIDVPIEEMIFVSRKESFAKPEKLGPIGSRANLNTKSSKLELQLEEIKDSLRFSSKKLIIDEEVLDHEEVIDEMNIESDKGIAEINSNKGEDISEEESLVDISRENELKMNKDEFQKISGEACKEKFHTYIDNALLDTKKEEEIQLENRLEAQNTDEIISNDIETKLVELPNQDYDFSFDKHQCISSVESSHKSFHLSQSFNDLSKNNENQGIDDSNENNLKALQELLDREEGSLSKESSQSKLRKIFKNKHKSQEFASESFSQKFNQNRDTPKIREGENIINSSSRIEDSTSKINDNYTFEPIFPMIQENYTKIHKSSNADSNNSKQEYRRSRNSSLPWIDESDIIVEKKPEKKNMLSKHRKNVRPKTQEKPLDRKYEPVSTKSSSQKKKIPTIPIRAVKQLPKFRANSHGKSKKPNIEKNQTVKDSARVKNDILDDIIFDEDQDSATWNKLMLKFRQNPVIISKLLKSKRRPVTQEAIRPSRNLRKFEKIDDLEYLRTSNNTREENRLASSIDGRPISAPEILPRSRLIPTRKIQDPDWSNSVLDNYVAQGKKKFNVFGDKNLLSPEEIEEASKLLLHRELNIQEQKSLFLRSVNTLSTLKHELLLPEFWINMPPFSPESFGQALSKCAKLLRGRALTVKAIELIHLRENALLDIMSHLQNSQGNPNSHKFNKLAKVNEELLQVLVFWKYMELPFSSFVYLGEDYYAKIHEDNSNLSTLFPDYHTDDIFGNEKSAESFLVDL